MPMSLMRGCNGCTVPDIGGMVEFDYRRHDAFAFVVVGIQILTGSLPYDEMADPNQLMRVDYVTTCVEAALQAEGEAAHTHTHTETHTHAKPSMNCLHEDPRYR